jgi:hypothetical protein
MDKKPYLGCASNDPKVEVFSHTNRLAEFDLAKFQDVKWLSSVVAKAQGRQIWFALLQTESNFHWWDQSLEQHQTIIFMCLGEPTDGQQLLEAMVEMIHNFLFGDKVITNFVRSPLYFFAVPNEVEVEFSEPPKPKRKIWDKIKIKLVP